VVGPIATAALRRSAGRNTSAPPSSIRAFEPASHGLQDSDVIEAIGNTPLIKLRQASEETGCTILGKAEFMNPGQSVKDRAALYIIKDALERKALGPGGTIVEGTAGNTGIGLAVVANAMGFKTVIVIPDNQSQEKKDTLRLFGAELVEVPPVPYRNPNNYVKYSARLAEELNARLPEGAIWANQFDNVANRRAHRETTAEEIWRQTDGKVDAFICAVGSGGTLGGVSDALKAKNRDIVIGLADPPGAALYSYYTSGELKAEGSSITEGIGQGRSPPTSPMPSSTRPSGSPTPTRCATSSTCSSTRACASAPRAASTSPAPSSSGAAWGRATPS
jgi:cysteine synthase